MAEKMYIGDVAERLNRRRATVRGWERDGLLPEHLRSHRDDRGWRYWTPDQVDLIHQWMIDADMRPGKAFTHYRPTQEQIAAHIEKCRASRSRQTI